MNIEFTKHEIFLIRMALQSAKWYNESEYKKGECRAIMLNDEQIKELRIKFGFPEA